MKFKLDENLPWELSGTLRQEGCDAHSVLDENLSGATDATIATVCREEQRVLITLDLDFADIRNYPPQDYHGIIVLRLANQDRSAVLALILRTLALLRREPIAQRLWMVDDHRTRIRGEA